MAQPPGRSLRGLGLWAGPLMSRKLDLRHGDAASGRGTCHGATQPPVGPRRRWQRLIITVTVRPGGSDGPGPRRPGPRTQAGAVRSDSGTQRQAPLANWKPRPGAGAAAPVAADGLLLVVGVL
jgi:hypothetical protein